MKSAIAVTVILVALCGCRKDTNTAQAQATYTTERDAMLIGAAREAALAHGWKLESRIYSVRPRGSGWIVQVDLAPGYDGTGTPSVVDDGTFFVHIDAEGRATRLLSHTKDVQIQPAHAPESQGG